MASNWTKIRAELWTRCDGMCEVTGWPLDPDTFDAHHRRPKGMGGTSRPDKDCLTNLLAVTSLIHNGGPSSIHGAPGWSRPRGYLVRKNVRWAASVPVFLLGRRWVLLGDRGGYLDLADIPESLRPAVPDLA